MDQSGHHVGPDGQEMLDYLTYVDDFIHALHTELDKRHILDIVNMVVVSDHGMTSTSNERVIYLDTILGEDGWNAIEHKEGKRSHQGISCLANPFQAGPLPV